MMSSDILQVTANNDERGNNSLLSRTKIFAVRIIKLVKDFPKDHIYRSIGNQLLRSGTSTSANYRASHKARSKAKFIAKLGVVAEEIDESKHWIELLVESGLIKKTVVERLYKEADEIAAMIHSSIKTARRNRDNK